LSKIVKVFKGAREHRMYSHVEKIASIHCHLLFSYHRSFSYFCVKSIPKEIFSIAFCLLSSFLQPTFPEYWVRHQVKKVSRTKKKKVVLFKTSVQPVSSLLSPCRLAFFRCLSDELFLEICVLPLMPSSLSFFHLSLLPLSFLFSRECIDSMRHFTARKNSFSIWHWLSHSTFLVVFFLSTFWGLRLFPRWWRQKFLTRPFR